MGIDQGKQDARLGTPALGLRLLGSLGVRNKMAGILTHEIEKPLTGFDPGGQPQPGLFKRGEVIPNFRRSRVASYLCTATCMLAASIWVSGHHLGL